MRTSLRTSTLRALMAVIAVISIPVSARAQAPTEFQRVGLQPNRDYLRLQPFEHLDTESGNVIVTLPLLTLPGNAGRTLQFTLTYNSNVAATGWMFGIAGTAMRVNEQATPNPGPQVPVTIDQTWGVTPLLEMADGGKRRTMFMNRPSTSTQLAITSDLWKYDRAANKLYMPDGTVRTYAPDPDGRLTELRDSFGNTVTLTWGQGTVSVVQDLGNGQARTIAFTLNTQSLPTAMSFNGHTWEYWYENGTDAELTRTVPPEGPGWTFTYMTPVLPARRLHTVTTPQGGRIEYAFGQHWLTVNDYEILLDARRTFDRGSTTPDEWTIAYALNSSGYSGLTTVTTPAATNRRLKYTYGPVSSSNAQINAALLIDGGIGLLNVTIEGDVSGGGSVLQSEQRTYTHLAALWSPEDHAIRFDAAVPWQYIVSRNGSPYTTTLTYNADGYFSHLGITTTRSRSRKAASCNGRPT